VDDEPKAIEVLERYCNDIDSIELKATFRDPVKAIEYLQIHDTDLILLDINMPRISGMEFLNILNKRPRIIFTTAYAEYAIESYDYEAVDYLLKPIDFHRFVKAISKTNRLISQEDSSIPVENSDNDYERTIYIKSGPQLYKVNISDILYLEKDGNYLIFHTKNRKMLSRQNMKDIFKVINPNDFIRVHKSFIVAIKHMEIIESHQIRVGDIKIPIGRNYREELMNITQNSTDENHQE
jgi:DNA-binding LytR/AlgR family response regulator